MYNDAVTKKIFQYKKVVCLSLSKEDFEKHTNLLKVFGVNSLQKVIKILLEKESKNHNGRK